MPSFSDYHRALAVNLIRLPRVLAKGLRRLCRQIRAMYPILQGHEHPLTDPVNERIGHVAVVSDSPESEGMMVLWGGYQEHRSPPDSWPASSHVYWEPDKVYVYNKFECRWAWVPTRGQTPPRTSGATAVVLDGEMFVMCGFVKDPALIEQFGYQEINTNAIYSLDLATWTWEKKSPEGTPPMRCDKLASWTYNGKIYLFGGFGPSDATGSRITRFLTDNLPFNVRGWNNQLVCYDPRANRLTWPDHYGDIPEPRAAHAVVRSGAHGLFLFGGRLLTDRNNDLFHLDLSRMRWVKLRPPSSPRGRSWHSLTKISDDIALLYGGYNTELKSMNDCWMLDMSEPELLGKSRWKQCRHLELRQGGKRLWHQAALESATGQVWVMGGVVGDLLNPDYVPPGGQPPETIRLSPSPLPLLYLATKARLKHSDITPEEETCLPPRVQKVLQLCKSEGA